MIRALVVDDSPLLRAGVIRLLDDHGVPVVGERADATDILDAVDTSEATVVVLDIRMPPTHTIEGLVAAATIRRERPNVAVVVLSQYIEASAAMDLLAGGAERVGYLLKDRVIDVEEFIDSVRRVERGGTAIDPDVVREMMQRRTQISILNELSGREREVLALMAEGRSNQAISDQLVVSIRTVESHIATILTKLDITATADDHRRVLAVLRYLEASS